MMEMGGEGTGDIFDKLPGWDMIRWNAVKKTEQSSEKSLKVK